MIVQQRQDLDFVGTQIHQRGNHVGFELHALQFQVLQIGLRQIAQLQTFAIHIQFAVPVLQVFLRILLHRLGLQGLHESVSQVEQERASLVE